MSLSSLFAPRSVCVLGASSDPRRIGGRPISYLQRARFKGRIFPVNPNREVVQDLPSYHRVQDLPERPDVAIIALAPESVLPAAEACVQAGIPWLIVFTAGFAESGPDGKTLQDALRSAVLSTGTRLVGPNSNGVMGVGSGAFMCLTPLLDDFLPRSGDVAVITQSAAIGTSYTLAQLSARHLGVRYWIHTGNEADLAAAEVLEWFVEEGRVKSIVLAFEMLRDLDRVSSSISRAARKGVVVSCLRTGRSDPGRAAAESHTAALIGARARVMEGVCRQAGASFGDSVHDLLDITEGALRIRRSNGRRVGVLTSSGGVGVMIADAVAEAGFELPAPSQHLRDRLHSIAPYCHAGNPVDVTAQVINEPEGFGWLLDALIDSNEFDILALFLPYAKLSDLRTQQLMEAARRSRREKRKIGFCVTGAIAADCLDALHDAGIAIFDEPAGIGRSLCAIKELNEQRRSRPRTLTSNERPEMIARLREAALGHVVDEVRSKAVLREYGLPVIADAVAYNLSEALSAAATVGYPVALKINVKGLAHKARAGGVVLDIRTPAHLKRAARRLLKLERTLPPRQQRVLVGRDFDVAEPNDRSGRPYGPSAAAPRLLVEPMRSGLELFLGIASDHELGPVALCGWGGTSVESQARVATRRLPLQPRDVAQMLDETQVSPALGANAEKVAAQLHRSIGALGRLWSETAGHLKTVDLNPVTIDGAGNLLVIDALIELDPCPADQAGVQPTILGERSHHDPV